LNVQGRHAVKEAIDRCLASLGNGRATTYARNFARDGEVRMNLIVEKMANARVAGVCFTKDPTIQQPQLLLEAVEGLGESLVDGSKEATRYHCLGQCGPWTADGNAGLLTDEERDVLAKEARKAAASMGCELDLEWAIDETGHHYWLQARPITTLGGEQAAIDEFTVKSDIHDLFITTCNVSEMLGGAVTPLTLCTFAKSIDRGMRDMFITTGVFKNADEAPDGTCTVSVNNTLFLNLTYMHMMSAAIFSKDEQVDISLCGRILPKSEKERKSWKRSTPRRVINMLRYMHYLQGHSKAKKRITELADHFSIADGDDPASLYRSLIASQDVLDEAYALHYVTSAGSGAMSSALFQILLAKTGSEPKAKSLVAQGMEDIDGIESADILVSLNRLKKAILQAYPDAGSWDGSRLLETIKGDRGEIKTMYDAFMARHGHRCVREAEMRTLSWADDEIGFASYLKCLLASPAQMEEHRVSDPEKCLADLHGITRLLAGYFLKQSRKGVVNREFTKSRSIFISDRIKKGYRKLAGLLREKGFLPDEDLIFFFTDTEIGQLLEKRNDALIRKAQSRRRLLAEQNSLHYPEISLGIPQPVFSEETDGQARTLQGTPISRGKARGKARVVRTLEDALRLEQGEIIVSPTTDIGWSPFYPLASGMVSEIGSVLSHGAVVAREYQLPFVSNIKGATSLIRTGDIITVDGTTGVVLLP
ncbi:MAG: PEP/pyruvate-binding domain-containing protein, partial [Sphaerochaetaceae bacterium]